MANWLEYNRALRQRGSIDVWLSDEIINFWYEPDRVNDGKGSPKTYSDFAIIVCHEIRYKMTQLGMPVSYRCT